MSEEKKRLSMVLSKDQVGFSREVYDVDLNLEGATLSELGHKFITMLHVAGYTYVESIIFSTGRDVTDVTDMFIEVDKDGDEYNYDRADLCEAMGSSNMEDMI